MASIVCAHDLTLFDYIAIIEAREMKNSIFTAQSFSWATIIKGIQRI